MRLEIKVSFTSYQFCDNAVAMQSFNCNKAIDSLGFVAPTIKDSNTLKHYQI